MCGGGGGSAQQAAQQQQAQQQAQIAQSTDAINKIFNSPQRQQQYTDYGNNLLNLYKQNLNYQQGIASRDLKFALARSGLTGGSYQADAGANLQHDYNQGLLSAESQAQQGKSQMEQADQQTKQNLIALAQSGLDATSAASMANSALASNIGNAQQYSNVNQLGNFFGDVSDYYKNSLQNQQNKQVNQYGVTGLFGAAPGAINWSNPQVNPGWWNGHS